LANQELVILPLSERKLRKNALCLNQSAAVILPPIYVISDENEISLYIINTCSDIQVMRIKKVITKDKMLYSTY